MKNLLTTLVFVLLFSTGIFLDSLLIDLVCSLFSLAGTWLVVVQVILWIILSLFTGGIVFVISFLTAGMIYTTLR
jgi:hypothetical protein